MTGRRGGRYEWEGSALCLGTTNAGQQCSNFEIEGLEHCLHHVPDDLLEEAEEITGWKRCRDKFGQPDACRFYAVEGTDPPCCKNHGANLGSNISKGAARTVIEDQAIRRLEEIMADDAAKMSILNPEPIGDPLTALLELAAEIRALRIMLRDRVMGLKAEEWRYKGREAELTRAEVNLWERAQEREGHFLIQISKLGIEGRLAAISERRMAHMERSLDIALKGSGLDLEGQERARTILRRELMKPSLN